MLFLALTACNPKLTGQKLYLYISEHNRSTHSDVLAAASKEVRKQGIKLVYQKLGPFLSKSVNEIVGPLTDGDSLAVVAYEQDWGPKLESRLKSVQDWLAQTSRQKSKPPIRFGFWLLGKGNTPKLAPALQSWPDMDAVSSASSERPAKTTAKKFFASLAAKSP